MAGGPGGRWKFLESKFIVGNDYWKICTGWELMPYSSIILFPTPRLVSPGTHGGVTRHAGLTCECFLFHSREKMMKTEQGLSCSLLPVSHVTHPEVSGDAALACWQNQACLLPACTILSPLCCHSNAIYTQLQPPAQVPALLK
jgi:hypothetical protein